MLCNTEITYSDAYAYCRIKRRRFAACKLREHNCIVGVNTSKRTWVHLDQWILLFRLLNKQMMILTNSLLSATFFLETSSKCTWNCSTSWGGEKRHVSSTGYKYVQKHFWSKWIHIRVVSRAWAKFMSKRLSVSGKWRKESSACN